MKKDNNNIEGIRDRRHITIDGQRFYKAAMTADMVFFVDYRESDEMAAVRAYDNDGALLSNNCHASNKLLQVLDDGEYTYLSPTTKANLKHITK